VYMPDIVEVIRISSKGHKQGHSQVDVDDE
jgi:hypothetical protein